MRKAGCVCLGLFLRAVVGYLAPILHWMIVVREDNPQIGLVSVFFGAPAGAVFGTIAGAILSGLSRPGPTGEP
jgi:hypothetical protein